MSNIKSYIVHKFMIGDVDDVELYAAEPIYNWQQTEAGKWVMEHSLDTYWTRHTDITTFSYQYKIVANFTEKDYTYYRLKYE